jgi:hypothetical protein
LVKVFIISLLLTLMTENMDNLPPEERIKKLKELEEKRKKEIAQAQKKIKESEDELNVRKKWVDKVPIPEITQNDFSGLSEEGKEFLRQQGKKEKIQEEVEEIKTHTPSLEETVEDSNIQMPRTANVEYGIQNQAIGVTPYKPMGEMSTQEIQKQMVSHYQSAQDTGYATREAAHFAKYGMEEIESRRETGYSFSQEAGEAASLIQKLGPGIHQLYNKEKVSSSVHDWYKGQ